MRSALVVVGLCLGGCTPSDPAGDVDESGGSGSSSAAPTPTSESSSSEAGTGSGEGDDADASSDGSTSDATSTDGDEGGSNETWPPPTIDERCDAQAPFTSVEPVPGLDAVGARFSPDERVVLLVRQKEDGSFGLWQAERESVDQPFGSPEELTLLNGSASDTGPTATPDGLTIFFYSSRPEAGGHAILRSRRDSVTEPFPAPVPVLVYEGGHVDSPYVSMDPGRLYYTGGAGGTSFVFETSTAGDPLMPGMVIDDTSPDVLLDKPVISADALTMYVRYFETNVASSDIAMSRRESTDQPFVQPQVVESLASGQPSIPMWISPDDCRLYFTRQDRNEVILVARR